MRSNWRAYWEQFQSLAIDISEARLDRALKCGADFAINANKDDPSEYMRQNTSGLGVDVALECIGKASTIRMAIDAVRIGGRAAMLVLVRRGSMWARYLLL